MNDRIRARRSRRPDGQYDVELYFNSEPPQVLAYIPLTQVPMLAMDLFLAVKGEAISRQEKAS